MSTRIYTRTGDYGDTGLFGGQRVRKDEPRVEAYGAVDEINAALGVARAGHLPADLDAAVQRIQNDLFALGADLATPAEAGERHGKVTIERIDAERATRLEAEIDAFEVELLPLTRFILPGGSSAAAAMHLARTVCRRAERSCVTLAADPREAINPEVVRYLNRLSDLLFVMARTANHHNGMETCTGLPNLA